MQQFATGDGAVDVSQGLATGAASRSSLEQLNHFYTYNCHIHAGPPTIASRTAILSPSLFSFLHGGCLQHPCDIAMPAQRGGPLVAIFRFLLRYHALHVI